MSNFSGPARFAGSKPSVNDIVLLAEKLKQISATISNILISLMNLAGEKVRQTVPKLAQGIGVQPRVKLVEPGSLNREAETSPLVIDLRQGVG